jgi:hypothetical protein
VLAQGPWLGYQLRSPLWSDATLCHGVRGGYALDLPELTLSGALGACRSRFHNDVLRARADELGVDISAAHVVDLPVVSVSLGGMAGGSWLRQSFDTPGRAPTRHSLGVSLGALLGVDAELGAGYHLLAEALGQVYVFEQRRPNSSGEAIATPALRLTLGVGKRY